MKKIKLGIPKGSLQKTTIEIFEKAGYNINISERNYFPKIDDPEIGCVLLRAQEISRYVEEGVLDVGITGRDWVIENGSKVRCIKELNYSKQSTDPVKWVLAVPENSKIKSVKDLKGKRIATEIVNVTNKYLRRNKVKADVEFSWGATEVKCPKLVDAIVEITETGTTLRENGLKIIDTVLESTTEIIMNRNSYKNKWKRGKVNQIALLLDAVLSARNKVGLKLNIEKKNLKKILKFLPAINTPTVSDLANKNWVAVEIITDEKTVRLLIPKLKNAGASGIVEYPLNKIIY